MVRIVADFHILPRQGWLAKKSGGPRHSAGADSRGLLRSGLWTVLPSYYMCSHYLDGGGGGGGGCYSLLKLVEQRCLDW